MAETTVTVKQLLKINGEPLVYGKEEDLMVIVFVYRGKEYRALQPFEDVSTEDKLITFLEKIIKKVPSLEPELKTENLTADSKGDYVVTE